MSNMNFRGGRSFIKPTGSERIENLNERMERIAKLSGTQAPANHVKNNTGITAKVIKEVAASDGQIYAILQEKSKYFIRKKVDENFINIGGHTLNENSYSSPTKAMNQMNLMFREINRLNEHKEQVDIYKKKV